MLLLAAPRIAGLLPANVPSSLIPLKTEWTKNGITRPYIHSTEWPPGVPTLEEFDQDIEDTLRRCFELLLNARYPKVIDIYPKDGQQ